MLRTLSLLLTTQTTHRRRPFRRIFPAILESFLNFVFFSVRDTDIGPSIGELTVMLSDHYHVFIKCSGSPAESVIILGQGSSRISLLDG